MEIDAKNFVIPDPEQPKVYRAPKTIYCKTKSEFDESAGSDFIQHANQVTGEGKEFLVGLSHGQSPAGPYAYILEHYSELNHPELIHYTFINSRLQRQRRLDEVIDASAFIKTLLNTKQISRDQVLGVDWNRDDMEAYQKALNASLGGFMKELGKDGLDYVFVASDPKGQVAGITRHSKAFESDKFIELVEDTGERELTITPWFLMQSSRISFLATKADKRRPLAWLYYRWGKPNESPSFLRFIEDVENRMTVYIDDHALTWPQEIVIRKTSHGDTSIRVDMAINYDADHEVKLPVVLMIHGFLGLNTFDALLTFIPSHKYVAAAMHYGSIPYDLPPKEYSQFVVENINAVVDHFGSNGHPVYIFDHSMANTYVLMIDAQLDKFEPIRKYVKGRISANPFFGREAKHAATNFLDQVILKSDISKADKLVFKTARQAIPLQSKKAVRNIGIFISELLIKKDRSINERIWKEIKKRLMVIITDMESLPVLNRVPLEHTFNRLPMKIFAIQIQSALRESKQNDRRMGTSNFEKHKLPTLILKSKRDPIARFIPEAYDWQSNVTIMDITNPNETDLFREHLYYIIHPRTTMNIIDDFISRVETNDWP